MKRINEDKKAVLTGSYLDKRIFWQEFDMERGARGCIYDLFKHL